LHGLDITKAPRRGVTNSRAQWDGKCAQAMNPKNLFYSAGMARCSNSANVKTMAGQRQKTHNYQRG
jgi:hypothetical protein